MSLTVQMPGSGRHRLLVVGNIPVDVVLRVPRLPTPGGDVAAESVVWSPGGSFHVLSAAAMAGLPGRYAGTHGTGAYGDVVRAALAAIGCDPLQPPAESDTGVVMTLVEPSGQRAFVTAPDTVVAYTPTMLSRLRPGPADVVYVSGYSLGVGRLSADLAGWVAALPRELVVCCDLGPWGARAGSDILGPVLTRVDWLACNGVEAATLTGYDDPRLACQALARRTPLSGVLVRVGADGCWLATPDSQPALVPAPRLAAGAAVDTTGAGDVHTGSFLAGLAEGLSPPASVARANAAAARSVTRGGPPSA